MTMNDNLVKGKAVSQNMSVDHSPTEEEKISKVNKKILNYYLKKNFFSISKA